MPQYTDPIFVWRVFGPGDTTHSGGIESSIYEAELQAALKRHQLIGELFCDLFTEVRIVRDPAEIHRLWTPLMWSETDEQKFQQFRAEHFAKQPKGSRELERFLRVTKVHANKEQMKDLWELIDEESSVPDSQRSS